MPELAGPQEARRGCAAGRAAAPNSGKTQGCLDFVNVVDSLCTMLSGMEQTATIVVNRTYELIQPLADGGTAVAWSARRKGDDRELVFKAYREPAAAAAVGEARRLRAVRHPAVVEVLDVGVVERWERAVSAEGSSTLAAERRDARKEGPGEGPDAPPPGVPAAGTPFVVTAFVPGADLEPYLQQLPEGRRDAAAAELFAQGLAALAHLHRRGLVHRDLHPGNLRVALRDGAPRLTLLDFDLSIPVGRSAPPGGRLGFVPPEQLLGRADPRSDLWALAAAVRWSLTRRDPLTNSGELPSEPSTWVPRVLVSDPVPLASVRPGAPAAFARTLDRCLARDPSRRPASAREALSWLDPERAAQEAPPDPWAFDPPFVGRAAELSRLVAWLDDPSPGRPVVACVVGPEASGRRRLVAEALQQATERALLAGRRSPRIVHQVVDRGEAGRTFLRGLLAESAAPDCIAFDATGLGGEAAAFVDQVGCMLRAAVDLGLGRSSATRAVLVLPARTPLVPGTERIELAPLSDAEIRTLLEGVLLEPPSAPVVRELAVTGGGWPGLVLAEAAARFPDGRPAVGATGRPAVSPADPAALDAAGRRVLARLAVERLPVPEDRLGDDGASPPEDEAAAALPRLQRLGWLHRSVAGWSVAPGRRAAAERLESPAVRRRRQRRLAEAPVVDGLGLLRRAWHRIATAPAVRLARVAAAEAAACRAVDPSAALSIGAWTLARDPRALDDAALAALGRAAVEAGRYDLGEAAIRAARRRPSIRRPAIRAAWAGIEAALRRRTGDVRGAEALLRRAAAGTAHPEALLELADLALTRGDVDAAARHLDAVGTAGAELAPRAAELRARVLVARGRTDEAERLVADALARAPATSPSRHRLWSVYGAAAHRGGRFREAAERFARALDEARASGDRHAAAAAQANLGAAMLEAGRVVEAVQRLRGAALDLETLGGRREQPAVLLNLANALVRIGDGAGVERVLARARATAAPEVWAGLQGYALALAADAARQRGDAATAEARLTEALARSETAADEGLAQTVRAQLADLRAAAGDAPGARSLLAAVPEAPANPATAVLRGTAELRAWLADGGAPPDAAIDRQARRLAAWPAPREHGVEWRAWLVLAISAARAGRAAAARAAAARAAAVVRDWREEVREMGFDPVGDDPETRTLEELLDVPPPASSPAPEPAGGPATTRERELRRWLSIQRRLVSERHPARLLDLILDTLIEIVGAERGMLLTRRGRTGPLQVRRVRNLAAGALGGSDGASISLSIAEQVARTGEPVVTMDARRDGRFLASRSVHDLGLRSVMVLPLLARGRTLGAVYLDHRLREAAFDPGLVEVALDFAGQAALVLETARHLRLLRRRRQEIERLNAELRRRVEDQAAELRGLKETIEGALPPEVADPFPGFVGRSAPMRELFRRMRRVAETDLPVLILGESGTGKELVARALHARGPRRAGPFVTENCAAIPESLLESILFGHVRGAFTGADRDHAGLFVVADKGTLFLDEIGELSLGLQAKLLRVLEDREVRPVGGSATRRIDVRILAASNRDIEGMVRDGRFREDLYYRLAVLTLRLPPLRDRLDDVPLLAAHFLQRHAPGRRVRLTPAAQRRLLAYGWPGNVRQLENTLVRALVLAAGDEIGEDCIDFGAATRPGGVSGTAAGEGGLDLRTNVEALERDLIERALTVAGGNRTKAAALLGLSRYGLLKKLQRTGGAGAGRSPAFHPSSGGRAPSGGEVR